MSKLRDPHAGQPVLTMGPKPQQARLAMILVHGRGASAEDIMGLTREFRQSDVAYLAPQAAGNTWYPYSFLAPIEKNEPALSSAIGPQPHPGETSSGGCISRAAVSAHDPSAVQAPWCTRSPVSSVHERPARDMRSSSSSNAGKLLRGAR